MPDVPDNTLEAEHDFDYNYGRDYSYGIVDQGVTGTASATSTASGSVTGTGAVSGTASATTTATGQVTSTFANGTASATTTASGSIVGKGVVTGTADTQLSASSTITSIQSVAATAQATTTASGTLPDATSDTAPIQWRLTRDSTDVEDAVYDVDPVVTTANPFGDYAVAKMDDRGGEKFAEYERGTRVDAAVSENAGITFEDQFTGYVVERRETEQSGADALEVEAYSFDQFLRRNSVTNDQTGNTITEALADIIQTDTPVSYVAGNVDVGDDQELTRSYQGEKVENVLRDLAFKSNNEEFGVNDDLEFFFRPRESTHIDRGIDNSQWFNYDIPELGKQAINEVEVWFNGGDESVVVDDGTDKLDLQDNLNLPEPGTQRAELQREDLTDIGDAEDEGRKYLEFRNATLSGTVTTYGLYDAQPGDTIDIEIAPRGIDEEFVIAGIEYRWGRDETILTIIEKRGDVDGILSELNDSVKRQEMAGADRDAPSNRITTTNATALVDVSVDADGNTPDDVRFVNDGRRAVRDGWADKGNVAISNLVVGDDGAGLSRSNTALGNQTDSVAVSEALPDSTSVTYSATVTQTGVSEVGLTDASGALIARAVFGTPVDLDGTVSVTLAVSNDASVSRGVLTDDGQTSVRDVLADNSPAIPQEYAYGSGTTAPTESDTSLESEVVRQNLDNIIVASADTQAEWESIVPEFGPDTLWKVENGELQQKQTTQFSEAEDLTSFAANEVTNSDVPGILSDDAGLELEIINDFVEFEISFDYDIPAGEITFDHYATRDAFDGEIELVFDGTVVSSSSYSGGTVENTFGGSPFIDQAITAGETYTARIRPATINSGTYIVDTVHVHDTLNRFTDLDTERFGTFDVNTASFDAPELYPQSQTISLNTISTTRDITQATAESTWDDIQNDQFIELSNDGSNFTRTNNSETASATFGSASRDLYVNIGLSHFANPTTTPTSGEFSQKVDLLNAFANPDAVVTDDIGATLTRAVIPPGELTGTTISEAGIFAADGSLLTRHRLADFDVAADQRLSSSETTRFTGDLT